MKYAVGWLVGDGEQIRFEVIATFLINFANHMSISLITILKLLVHINVI